LRGDIEKAVGDIAGKNGCGARAAAQTHGEAHDVASDDGGKKERAEEAASVTLRAGGEIESGAGGVDHHAPLGDADAVREKIAEKNDEKTRERNAGNRGAQRSERKKAQKKSEDEERRGPAQENEKPAARRFLCCVGANHFLIVERGVTKRKSR
jgi:hypothetical protein